MSYWQTKSERCKVKKEREKVVYWQKTLQSSLYLIITSYILLTDWVRIAKCVSIKFLNSTLIQYAGNFTWDLFNIGQISVYLRENIPSIFFKALVYDDVLFIGMFFLNNPDLVCLSVFIFLMLFYCKVFHLLFCFFRCNLCFFFWARAGSAWIFPCSENGATNTDVSWAYLNLKEIQNTTWLFIAVLHQSLHVLSWIQNQNPKQGLGNKMENQIQWWG